MDEKLYYLLVGTLFGTFLGWFLGLFSPIISTFIMRVSQKREIKRGIYNELNDVKLRMAMAVHLLSPHFVSYDRKLLTWLQPYYEEFDRLYSGKNLAQNNKKILEELTDEQFNAAAAMKITEKPNQSYNLKHYSLPFLECHMGSLAIFDADFQRNLMEIRTQISILNDEISMSRFYFEKTFDKISPENYPIIVKNLSEAYQHIAGMLQRLVDKISTFIAT
jgi:hypothetical protein